MKLQRHYCTNYPQKMLKNINTYNLLTFRKLPKEVSKTDYSIEKVIGALFNRIPRNQTLVHNILTEEP